MSQELDRRQALAAFESVSLAALLAACGGDGESDTAAQPTEVATTAGATAAVQTQTATSTATSELFADATTCRLSPEETEGPYYFDVDSIRSDIREDRGGATLRLAVRVRDASSCSPLPNAVVDVWHCDALGVYSSFDSAGGETFLRGAQVTNADGIVEFLTIYPGWYPGRTTHIHAKVHLDRATALTTQFYFDDSFTDAVYERDPYAQDPGRDTFNDTDGIFDEQLLLTLSEEGDGYLGLITLDVATD